MDDTHRMHFLPAATLIFAFAVAFPGSAGAAFVCDFKATCDRLPPPPPDSVPDEHRSASPEYRRQQFEHYVKEANEKYYYREMGCPGLANQHKYVTEQLLKYEKVSQHYPQAFLDALKKKIDNPKVRLFGQMPKELKDDMDGMDIGSYGPDIEETENIPKPADEEECNDIKRLACDTRMDMLTAAMPLLGRLTAIEASQKAGKCADSANEAKAWWEKTWKVLAGK